MEVENCRRSSSIPEDVIYQLLLRLPVTSLVRFRCVSRTWCNTIDSVSFANIHLTREAATAADEESRILALPFRKEPPEVQHSVICDGNVIKDFKFPILEFCSDDEHPCHLVCRPAYGLLCFRDRAREIFLCNPLRGEVLKLPHPTSSKSSMETEYYGVGFDCITNTYKIVRVLLEEKIPTGFAHWRTEVFTLGTRSWRRISSVPPSSLNLRGVSAYGDMHWMNENYHRSVDQSAALGMLTSFDFKKEEFKLTPHPKFDHNFFEKFMLVNLKGSLAVLKFSSASTPTHMEIWMLKDYEKKDWVRQYRISVQEWVRPSYRRGPHLFLWRYLKEPQTACGYSSNFCFYLLDLTRNYIFHIQSPQPKVGTHNRMILDYTGSVLCLKNFGNSFSAAEDPAFNFLTTARLVSWTASSTLQVS